MSTNDIEALVEMGFLKSRAEKALAMTGHKGIEPAMEWMLAHEEELEADNPINDQPVATGTAMETDQQGSSASAASEAKSIKCDDCGKLMRSQEEVEFHAAKTGHDKFSESTEEKKPLTEEEKKEQLKKLEEKIKEKRKEREEKEKIDALEREKTRIKSGKEMVAAKKKLEEEEIKKAVEQRKREKQEDKLARERVKAQIEADKAARKAKLSGEAAPAPAPTPTTAQPEPTSAQPRHYTETKLQIRLTNGQTLTQTFNPKEQLSAVRLYIQMNRSDGDQPFSLMTNFPKKVFQDEDFEKPLEVLGLVPAAVVIVTRAH